MSTFPSLTPSSRTFTPGEYPNSSFLGMSGKQGRVRHSTAMLASQLRLSFIGLSETEMLSILSHYQGQQGGYLSFDLPSSILSGFTASDFTLTGYTWRYAESPQVEDFGDKLHTVALTLESVPPEGAAVAGLAQAVQTSLVSGAGTGSANTTGITATLAFGLAAGSVGGDVEITPSGIAKTVTTSLAAGAPTSDQAMNGFAASVTASFSAGTATGSGGATDPYFSSVVLLMHMDGTNGSTTFTDNSSNAFTITTGGTLSVSTATVKYGTGAALFTASQDALNTPANSALALGTGDFTVEMWIYPTNLASNRALWSASDASKLYLRINFVGELDFYINNNKRLNTSALISVNNWYHIALTRASDVFRLYVNGVHRANHTESYNHTVNQYCICGASNDASFRGYLDDFRVTKGVARYTGTGSFTPPTAAFPDS